MTADSISNRAQSGRNTKRETATQPPDLRGPDAFVIDDEPGICHFISNTLDALGLVAESFHTADEAIAGIQRGQPEIVFLDIELGESDAVDVIRALGRSGYRGLVQLMSGNKSALLDDVHRVGAFHGLNMCRPLEKPFRMDAVRQTVASIARRDQPQVTLSFAPLLLPDLDFALANGWLELWYQPRIDLRTKALVGAEGLIKYRHPVLGIHAIDKFLPQATTATRVAITERFIVTALRDWQELDRAGINIRTAVKASFDALSDLDLTSLVRHNRPKSSKWPGLVLEISEHEFIADLNLAHEIATQLRIYDITLAIDNFGAGFSSFERLRELPFSELNLHAGFVAGCAEDARNASMCRAAIDLAHHCEAVAVANGLDNASDLQALQHMGCDVGQGPLLSDPVPLPQFMAALHGRINQAWLT